MPLDRPTLKNPRATIWLLAASLGLMMTGYGVIMPVFAKRLGELGDGVQTLGFMTMGFAAAQFVLAPVMGSLADRLGRRPLILVALAGFVVANLAFLVAQSGSTFVLVRVFEGAVTAGLLPSAMGVVADSVPETERARWTGILMGSYSAGFIFGPAFGGFLYDHFGFRAPFEISAGLGLLALVFALLRVPETSPGALRQAARARAATVGAVSLLASLPRPLARFATLLVLDFVAVFVFAFIEPQMVFYFYDRLNFSTTRFGVVVGAYGLAMVLGQTLLGQLSDRFGRRPVIVLGFALNVLFYAGLIAVTDFGLILAVAVIAGLGSALLAPAVSAFYLDITAEEHRARIMGLKESAAALGGVAGPLLVALASGWLSAQQVFLVSGLVTAGATLLALVALTPRPRPAVPLPGGEALPASLGVTE